MTEEDLADDTGADTLELDAEKNPNSKQARMWTLYQLHRLFSVQLRRSDVRNRLDINDDRTVVLENKVAELERWRIDLESRIQATTDLNNETFESKQHQIQKIKEHIQRNEDTMNNNQTIAV